MKRSLKIIIAPGYESLAPELEEIETLFSNAGETIQENRNTIKATHIAGKHLVIKSFKELGLVRGFIYRFFRPSKARRSYEYARKLIELGFSTPEPIAYIEEQGALSVRRSYFISLFLPHDFLIKDALHQSIDDYDKVIEQFISFTFKLHNANVLHLDHSPGNTLITSGSHESNHRYTFSLVDINRMKFAPVPLQTRLENFTRLTRDEATLKTIAEQYAALANQDPAYCFKVISEASWAHFKKLDARRRIKQWFKAR